jgi:GDP-L-fucose synthase
MKKKVFIAGHRGLIGSATVKALSELPEKYDILARTHKELDLEDQQKTMDFFVTNKPDYVVICAAKVGGILANSMMPVDFLHNNLRIQLNIFDAAYKAGVERIIFLGSSCIYPRDCPQPIREEYLLTSSLEETNRAYALAKIAGVESCRAFNMQYGTQYLALMPTNMYGPHDNYHPEHSHVLPALIRRFHEAKMNNEPSVIVWGSGKPKREFMFSLDLGDAIKFLLELPDSVFSKLTAADKMPLVNVGTGEDITIQELADMVRVVVGYKGELKLDTSKPDGTMRKLLDISRLQSLGWKSHTKLDVGLKATYQNFLNSHSTVDRMENSNT